MNRNKTSNTGKAGMSKAGVLVGFLALGLGVTNGQAQDTATVSRDTTSRAGQTESAQRDTAQQDSTQWGYSTDQNPDVQNPQGYRGMERPVNVFPPDTGAQGDTAAVGDATNRVNQMERQDTLEDQNQNPPGYRGMERPAAVESTTVQGGDTAKQKDTTKKAGAKKSSTKQKTSKQKAARDTTAQRDTTSAQRDTTSAQRDTTSAQRDTTSAQGAQRADTAGQQTDVQNPPGYRGMERPVNVFPSDTGAQGDTAAVGDATSRVNQMERQDTLGNQDQNQNPPGYRGMERPSSVGQDTAGDTTRAEPNPQEGDTTTTTSNNRRDSVDIIHQQRRVPPGVDRAPPPYPADSEKVWVEQQPSNDSISVSGEDRGTD